jgi:hypothetical protein
MPFLFGPGGSDDKAWEARANIGQAYGGVSAVLSAFALCGVAASLIIQRHQARVAQFAAMGVQHFEMMRTTIEFPETLRVEASPWASDPDGRLYVMANMNVSLWKMGWDLRAINEPALRFAASLLLGSEVGQRWWTGGAGRGWERTATDRRGRAFVAILNEEAARARLPLNDANESGL